MGLRAGFDISTWANVTLLDGGRSRLRRAAFSLWQLDWVDLEALITQCHYPLHHCQERSVFCFLI